MINQNFSMTDLYKIQERLDLHEKKIDKIAERTEEINKKTDLLICKLELKENQLNILDKNYYEDDCVSPTIALNHYTVHYIRSYEYLNRLISDKSRVVIEGFFSPQVVCTKNDGSEFKEKIPLQNVVKKINHLFENTSTFTNEEREIATNVAARVNKMWDEADTLIQNKNFIVRLFHEIRKFFSWKILIKSPKLDQKDQ